LKGGFCEQKSAVAFNLRLPIQALSCRTLWLGNPITFCVHPNLPLHGEAVPASFVPVSVGGQQVLPQCHGGSCLLRGASVAANDPQTQNRALWLCRLHRGPAGLSLVPLEFLGWRGGDRVSEEAGNTLGQFGQTLSCNSCVPGCTDKR
jgi:hypothetical protein